jgi:hypothetical protein
VFASLHVVKLASQVAFCAQLPFPSQVPLLPQTPLAAVVPQLVRGALPDLMFVQVPTLLQVWQAVQAVWQQIPPMQCPLVQSVSMEHLFPSASLSPQLLVVILHVTPEMQSLFALQVLRQVVEPHTKGSHFAVWTAGHWVPPLQLAARVWTPAVQLS